MNKKATVLFACIVLLAAAIPVATALPAANTNAIEIEKEDTGGSTYFSCYIEATGLFGYGVHMLFFRPLGGDFVMSLISTIGLTGDASTTIYTAEGGDVLYRGSGESTLGLLGFHGNYVHNEDEVTLIGKATLARVS